MINTNTLKINKTKYIKQLEQENLNLNIQIEEMKENARVYNIIKEKSYTTLIKRLKIENEKLYRKIAYLNIFVD